MALKIDDREYFATVSGMYERAKPKKTAKPKTTKSPKTGTAPRR